MKRGHWLLDVFRGRPGPRSVSASPRRAAVRRTHASGSNGRPVRHYSDPARAVKVAGNGWGYLESGDTILVSPISLSGRGHNTHFGGLRRGDGRPPRPSPPPRLRPRASDGLTFLCILRHQSQRLLDESGDRRIGGHNTGFTDFLGGRLSAASGRGQQEPPSDPRTTRPLAADRFGRAHAAPSTPLREGRC